MIEYIEYIGLPGTVAVAIVAAFFVMQAIGELLELKGKVVPEVMKVRKIFTRKKEERRFIKEAAETLEKVQKSLDDLNTHYSTDNIGLRDKWIKLVNGKLEQYDDSIRRLDEKLEQNNQDTQSILIESKRNAIISFASFVIDESKPATREQFNRIFRLYQEYEGIIQERGITNGEVDIAIRIIRESYENHMRSHTFVEDIRGYNDK